jgi:hypothetical protein
MVDGTLGTRESDTSKERFNDGKSYRFTATPDLTSIVKTGSIAQSQRAIFTGTADVRRRTRPPSRSIRLTLTTPDVSTSTTLTRGDHCRSIRSIFRRSSSAGCTTGSRGSSCDTTRA